jgi:septum formation protein
MPTRRLVLGSKSPRRADLLAHAGYAFRQVDPPYDDPADPNPSDAAPPHAHSPHAAASPVAAVDRHRPRPALSHAGRADSARLAPPPADRALDLARRKARSLAPLLAPDELGLAADTLCVDHAGRLVGTPTDPDQAAAMIAGFIDRSHEVITAVALIHPDGALADAFADAATVALGPVLAADLAAYLASDRWRGKAGGYHLPERLAAGWPLRVTGDADTVVGLPIARLGRSLRALGVRGR